MGMSLLALLRRLTCRPTDAFKVSIEWCKCWKNKYPHCQNSKMLNKEWLDDEWYVYKLINIYEYFLFNYSLNIFPFMPQK